MRGRADDIQPSSSSIARPSPIRIGSLINAWNQISPQVNCRSPEHRCIANRDVDVKFVPYTDECLTTSGQLVRSRGSPGSETRAITICSSQSLNRSGRTTTEPVPPPDSSRVKWSTPADCRFVQNIRGIGAPRCSPVGKRTGLRMVPTLALEIIEWLDFRRSSP